jgi:hypothetical protein
MRLGGCKTLARAESPMVTATSKGAGLSYLTDGIECWTSSGAEIGNDACGQLSLSPRPLLRLHQVRENVVDPRQVTFAFGPQPSEDPRVQAHTNGYLARSSATQPYHVRQLFIGQARDVFEVNARVVHRRLTPGNAAQSLALLFSPLPVPDIFGSRAFQPRGLR